MVLFAHAVNNINDLKAKLKTTVDDGLELDFQLCGNHLINTHHFYFSFPLIKSNWLCNRSYLSLKPYQTKGLCYDLKTILELVKEEKLIIIDLKNWVFKIPGMIFGNGSAYLYNQNQFAHVFWDYLKDFKDQNNILIQSYDHDLIIKIIKVAKERNITNNFKYGLIIRTNFQIKSAINYTKKYNINFLAIRYLALKKIGGSNKLLQIIKKPIKIYGWFDIDDFYLSKEIRENLINKMVCDGYIK